MPINFPNSPSQGQVHSQGKKRWRWSGEYWKKVEAMARIEALEIAEVVESSPETDVDTLEAP